MPSQIVVSVTPETYPKVHHAISHPSHWNSVWERLYNESPILVSPAHLLSYARTLRENTPSGPTSNPDDMHRFITNYQSTCEIQHRIGVKVLDRFVNEDFERRWREASLQQRRWHVLVGLANGGKQAKNLNMARAYSADVLTLNNLSMDGTVLLKLLKDITPQNISVVPTEPYYVPSEAWDSARAAQERDPSASELDKFDLMEMIILRTKLIYLVVEGIMDSFLGKPLPTVNVHKQRDRRPVEAKKQDLKKMKADYIALYGEELGKQKVREELIAWDERKSRRSINCEACSKDQVDNEKFMRCKKCWEEIQREVHYCGKSCQHSDWKARHRLICGKSIPSIDAAIQMSRPKSVVSGPNDSQFGPPTNGFKRTPQLISHIRELDQRPYVDFIVQVRRKGDTEDVQIQYPPIWELIRAARQAAMVDGNREATAKLCHFLIWYLRAKMMDVQDAWDLNCAVDRMEKEFEYPNLRRVMKEMQDKQWEDSLKRPPLVVLLPKHVWTQFITDNDGPLGGKFQWHRRMEQDYMTLRNTPFYAKAPAIWNDDTVVSETGSGQHDSSEPAVEGHGDLTTNGGDDVTLGAVTSSESS